jgi:hypothetical protein
MIGETLLCSSPTRGHRPRDTFWMGELPTPQRYVVSAILSDLTGIHLDQLDFYQELQG